jgi:hypothetical protein
VLLGFCLRDPQSRLLLLPQPYVLDQLVGEALALGEDLLADVGGHSLGEAATL